MTKFHNTVKVKPNDQTEVTPKPTSPAAQSPKKISASTTPTQQPTPVPRKPSTVILNPNTEEATGESHGDGSKPQIKTRNPSTMSYDNPPGDIMNPITSNRKSSHCLLYTSPSPRDS